MHQRIKITFCLCGCKWKWEGGLKSETKTNMRLRRLYSVETGEPCSCPSHRAKLSGRPAVSNVNLLIRPRRPIHSRHLAIGLYKRFLYSALYPSSSVFPFSLYFNFIPYFLNRKKQFEANRVFWMLAILFQELDMRKRMMKLIHIVWRRDSSRGHGVCRHLSWSVYTMLWACVYSVWFHYGNLAM